MSIQRDIEEQIIILLDAAIPGVDAVSGPRPTSRIEGLGRAAVVRQTSGAGERLGFAQNQWTETFALTVYWPTELDRDDVITEWEAFASSMLANNTLGGSIAGLSDAFLSATSWGEAHDSPHRIMTATVETVRVE